MVSARGKRLSPFALNFIIYFALRSFEMLPRIHDYTRKINQKVKVVSDRPVRKIFAICGVVLYRIFRYHQHHGTFVQKCRGYI